MVSGLHDEITRNYGFFESIVATLMPRHAGHYALLRDQALVEVYRLPNDAVQAGLDRFTDGRFSVQRVIDRPLDLGFMSYGAGDGTAD